MGEIQALKESLKKFVRAYKYLQSQLSALKTELGEAREVISGLLKVTREHACDYEYPENDNYEYWTSECRNFLQKYPNSSETLNSSNSPETPESSRGRMAKYNSAIEVTFNDNDGGVGWRANPQSASDVIRHHVIFGKWRARWIFFKRFWYAMTWLEKLGRQNDPETKIKLWIFRAEISE